VAISKIQRILTGRISILLSGMLEEGVVTSWFDGGTFSPRVAMVVWFVWEAGLTTGSEAMSGTEVNG
jgi:hypothetical protein